ncbi:MAG: hypothetical protein NC184_07535 [Roseburia sp.]|nr:hypothetical protein [Roseburia sp.]
MKDKEITIYDNYYSLDRERETREYLFDEYGPEKNWKSPEDIPYERVFDEIDFQDREMWYDVKAELKTLFDNNVYLFVRNVHSF